MIRPLRLYALLALLALLSVATRADAQEKLFKGDSVVNITITTQLQALVRQRDS